MRVVLNQVREMVEGKIRRTKDNYERVELQHFLTALRRLYDYYYA